MVECDVAGFDRAWPLVTVAVLVYNQAAYVRRCLDSVLATNYANLELFILDAASKDASASEVDHWFAQHSHRARMVFHRCAETHSVGSNLNRAIDWSRGEYFLPLAADDELLSGGLAERVAHLERRPDQLAVFGDCHVIDECGRSVHESGIFGLYRHKHVRRQDLLDATALPGTLVFQWAVPGPVILLRRAAFDRVGKYSEDLAAEDWDIFLRLAAVGGLSFLNKIVSRYRLHGQNTSRQKRSAVIDALIVTAARNHRLYRGAAGRRLRLLGTLTRWRGGPRWQWRAAYWSVGAMDRAYCGWHRLQRRLKQWRTLRGEFAE